MKLKAEVKVGAIKQGSFEDEDGKIVEYFQVQFLDDVTKKLGEDFITLQEVATAGISKELASELEVGNTYECEIRVKATNPKSGFPKIKYSIVGVE